MKGEHHGTRQRVASKVTIGRTQAMIHVQNLEKNQVSSAWLAQVTTETHWENGVTGVLSSCSRLVGLPPLPPVFVPDVMT